MLQVLQLRLQQLGRTTFVCLLALSGLGWDSVLREREWRGEEGDGGGGVEKWRRREEKMRKKNRLRSAMRWH
uniref:Uncharacterized protein n=1 Tax=Pristionchus pacificus TaxID=54126 RepID=A0A2A6BQF0_PRIPA|eukprot:PDM68013.1 hypothetical protein PRIPAC_46057 [Pristionchus pacificus]